MKLQLVTYPDKRLSQVCEAVQNFEPGAYDELIEGMFQVMRDKRGIGLAAPQVGHMIRLIIVSVSGTDFALINPEITYRKGNIAAREACLSYPGRSVFVRRATVIHVAGLNTNAEAVEFKASNMLARVIQHEIDHLDGVCRVSPAAGSPK